MAEIGEAVLTPLPRFGHNKYLSTDVHSTTIMLMQNEYVLAFEVAQSFLTPEMMVAVWCFDVGHECGEVLDPCIVSFALCVLGLIWNSQVPLEKIALVCVWFVTDVDRISCFPFIVPEGDEVAAEFELVFDAGYLALFDRVFDCIKTFFREKGLVSLWVLWIIGARMEGIYHSSSEAAVVHVLDVDDCMLPG